MDLIKEIEQKLRTHNIKPTAQRMEIGQLLFAQPRHVSADHILAELRAASSRVSKATVYNTLNLFTRQGLLREVPVDPERQYYDSTSSPHHHFYNVDTGELTDIGDHELEFAQLPPLPEGTEAQGTEVVIRIRNRR